METLNEDFVDFIRLLEDEGVEYLVVGGYAVGVHGFPRYTGDLDFLVAINERNAEAMMRVLQRFGFGGTNITKADFLKPTYVVEIGREPRKIQILTAIDGVSFAEARAGQLVVEYEGLHVKFIGRQELIKNKLASGRSKDLIDADELTKQPPGN